MRQRTNSFGDGGPCIILSVKSCLEDVLCGIWRALCFATILGRSSIVCRGLFQGLVSDTLKVW